MKNLGTLTQALGAVLGHVAKKGGYPSDSDGS